MKTTHDHPTGVAAGVVKCFQNCLEENNIRPEDVVFVAHSTTQATNALIEGDIAQVGIIGLAKGGLEGWLAKRQTRLQNIDLGNSKEIKIYNSFLNVRKMSEASVVTVIDELKRQGAQVIVPSMAFGVDNGRPEELVYIEAEKKACRPRWPPTLRSCTD